MSGPKLRSAKGTQFPHPDYEVLWALDADEKARPILHRSLSDDTPRRIRSFKVTRLIPYNQNSYKCFFTGVECFIGYNEVFWSRNNNPWLASKEHLLSRYHHAKEYARDWNQANFVFAGSRINYELGHIPASLKLWFRRYLRDKQYDRTDTVNQNGSFDVIFKLMLDCENHFTMHGKYPWHPTAYSLVSQRRAAQEFVDRINVLEREFFAQLTLKNRFEHFDSSVLPIEVFY